MRTPVKCCSLNSSWLKFALVGIFIVSSPVSAAAQQNGDPKPEGDWQITLGGGAIVAPDYIGAKKLEIDPLPLIDIVLKDRIFLSTTQGLGVYAINDKDSGLTLGLSVVPGNGRIVSKVEPRLRGLGKLSIPVQGRVFGSFSPNQLISLSASVGKDFGGTNGYSADIGASIGAPIGNKLLVGASATVSYYDRKLKQGLLGVTAAQSTATGFRVFAPKAGLHSVSFGLSANYALTDHIGIIALVNADRLLGSSARSPVIERKWDRSAGLALTYTF